MKLHWVLWGESGGIHVIVWMWVSDRAVQVCSIPCSRPVFMKVCQHVWRRPVLTDIIQVFSPTCIPPTDRIAVWKIQKWKKAPSACCHACVLLWMIYEMGGGTWLVCVCARGQMILLYDLLYTGVDPSGSRSHLLLVLSCLTNRTHNVCSQTEKVIILSPAQASS